MIVRRNTCPPNTLYFITNICICINWYNWENKIKNWFQKNEKVEKDVKKVEKNENKVEKSLRMEQDDNIDPVYKIPEKKTENKYMRKRWE